MKTSYLRFLGCFLVCAMLPLAAQTDINSCNETTVEYNQGSFDQDDFLAVDQGVIVDDSIHLDTDRELDLDNLVLGLDQPLFVDYLAEGAGASHLFGFFFFDIDTDKDGLPDFLEIGPADDLDGDGILNADDTDDDNDGIPDASDREPAGINSMPASHFRNGTAAAAAGAISGDYWQFVPNSVLSSGPYAGFFEHPGAYLYVDNNGNEIPDNLEYIRGANRIPPYCIDKGYWSRNAVSGNSQPGVLGVWEYAGTPGDTVEDRYHWLGSTVYYIADDDGGTGQTSLYHTYSPYGTQYGDVMSSTNAIPDYLIYGTSNINSDAIPSELKNNDGSAKKDPQGVEMWRYRWYQDDVSGAREMVFFLVVFYGSGGSNVNTYYSKSAYNPDDPPGTPGRNGATSGDAYGDWTSRSNWFPVYRNRSEHDALANAVFGGGVDEWSDIATEPTDGSMPVAHNSANQEWVDQWENWSTNRRVIQYRALRDWFSGTSVDANTVINGRYGINMALENDSSVIRAINGRMAHLMVGAPRETKNAWLLGWEDLFGGGDRDYEDVVFYVKREAGGQVQSLNVAADARDKFEDFSLTQITFTFEDNFVESLWGTEGRYVNYYYRLGSSDDWIPLLGGRHERDPDLFQPDFGGSTDEGGGSVKRTVTIEVQEKKQEIYWKAEMATDNVDTFQPEVTDAKVAYQVLVHDFYYNAAVIPNSNISYIPSYESPSFDWDVVTKNRGHLYALKTFEHGAVTTATSVGTNPEENPTTQPDSPFQWDAGVSMADAFRSGTARKIYTYVPLSGTESFSNNLSLKTLQTSTTDSQVVEAFDFTDEKNNNVWVHNYHDPAAPERDEASAALWLQNWIHGYLNPIVADGSVVDPGPTKEWILGGINRGSVLLLRSPGFPGWLFGAGVEVDLKRSYLAFAQDDAQLNMDTRILIGSEAGLLHCLDAGTWVSTRKNPDDVFADGHYKDDNYGTGKEVWSLLPGHLLDDMKYNYTGTATVTAKIDATANGTIVYDGSNWRRIAILTQGYKAGTHDIAGKSLTGNVVIGIDITDVDSPKPLWQRAESNAQDITSPVSMGWAELSTGHTWIAGYPSGATPVSGTSPGFTFVEVVSGTKIDSISQNVGSAGNGHVMLGSPALLDVDSNGLVDHAVGATSEGLLFAIDLRTGGSPTTFNAGSSSLGFFHTPNVLVQSDGTILVVAVSGDNPFTYDESRYGGSGFVNKVFVSSYDPSSKSWESKGTFDLAPNHKPFSRPLMVGNRLILGTSTGDTVNICDVDESDPGNLYLIDLEAVVAGEDALADSLTGVGSFVGPIMFYGNTILAHTNTTSISGSLDTPYTNPFRTLNDPKFQEPEKTSVAEVFGAFGSQNSLQRYLDLINYQD